MVKKMTLRIPIKNDKDKPISAAELRTIPEEIMTAETPEGINANMRAATKNVRYLPEMLSISEASARTNLSYEYLRHLCYSGKVNHIRCGRKYMIDSDSLAEFIRNGGVDQ